MPDSLFLIGQVIHDLEQDCDYRLLWTSSTPDFPSYWLRLPGNSNVPEKVSLEALSDGIEKGSYSFAPDIWRPVRSGEAGETALRLRDKAWDLIRDAVADEPAIYDPGKRRGILLGIEEKTGTKVPNLYKYLGKYWRVMAAIIIVENLPRNRSSKIEVRPMAMMMFWITLSIASFTASDLSYTR